MAVKPLELRLYAGDKGQVAYAADGRTWRTSLIRDVTEPVGCNQPWVIVNHFGGPKKK